MIEFTNHDTHKLYFVNSRNVSREILSIAGLNLTDAEIRKIAFQKMREFCEERNFTIYYTRSWNATGKTIFDVGSHTEFFHLVPALDAESYKEE